MLGTDDDIFDAMVWGGEGENVYDRILQYIGKKDCWNEAIFFVSIDDNLTKTHVKFLENRTVKIDKKANRYKIENGNIPQACSLPESDIDSMEEFLECIKLLLGVLGHKILESYNSFYTS